MGLTLSILLGLGIVVIINALSCLPSMDHNEVFEGFSRRFSLKKKEKIIYIIVYCEQLKLFSGFLYL
jgi:hypothetical protein